jgi:hypothetical protein
VGNEKAYPKRMPVGLIQPKRCAINIRTNSATEKPTRKVSALTVRLFLPVSRIRKKRAEPRLPIIRMNAMATMIFIRNGFSVK